MKYQKIFDRARTNLVISNTFTTKTASKNFSLTIGGKAKYITIQAESRMTCPAKLYGGFTRSDVDGPNVTIVIWSTRGRNSGECFKHHPILEEIDTRCLANMAKLTDNDLKKANKKREQVTAEYARLFCDYGDPFRRC